MPEVFRFASLRGAVPGGAGAEGMIVAVARPGTVPTDAGPLLRDLAAAGAARGWRLSLRELGALAAEVGDAASLATLVGRSDFAAAADSAAMALLDVAEGSAGGERADAAAAQLVTAALLRRAATDGSWRGPDETAERSRHADFAEHAVLTVPVPADGRLTRHGVARVRSASATGEDLDGLRARLAAARRAREEITAWLRGTSGRTAPVFDATALAVVEELLGTLEEDHLNPGGHQVPDPVAAIELLDEVIRRLVGRLASAGDRSDHQPGRGVPPGNGEPPAGAGPIPVRIGVADLLTVETTGTAYGYGEISHVENVMTGELRERTFTRTRSSETELFTATESDTTTETDQQSTQRFELETAASEAVEDTLTLEADGGVSGTFGPVTVQSSFGVSSVRSKESSYEQSSRLAQEVVSRAAKTVHERARTERRETVKVVTEDRTRHAFDNTGDGGGHVTGIHRWVDKRQTLRLVDHGKRLMLGLTVPEPGALLRWAAARRAAVSGGPVPPTVPEDGGTVPLRPDHLTPDNYLTWVAAYGATSVEPPPDRYVTVSLGLHHDPSSSAEKPGVVTRTDLSLTVPAGYRAVLARGAFFAYEDVAAPSPTSPSFEAEVEPRDAVLAVGNLMAHLDAVPTQGALTGAVAQTFSLRLVPGVPTASGSDPATGAAKLPVLLNIGSSKGYALTVEVVCERSDTAVATWRGKAWTGITEAYATALEAFRDAETQARLSLASAGRAPAENRRVERAELKRAVVDIVHGTLDAGTATELDAVVEHLEGCFEWENMSWRLLDYFYAARETWETLLAVEDPDEAHRRFLAAGAASVQVPVRRGYEARALIALATTPRWPGERAPVPGLDGLVALGAEVLTAPESPRRGTPVPGSEWTETLPTDLVILQPGGGLDWTPAAAPP